MQYFVSHSHYLFISQWYPVDHLVRLPFLHSTWTVRCLRVSGLGVSWASQSWDLPFRVRRRTYSWREGKSTPGQARRMVLSSAAVECCSKKEMNHNVIHSGILFPWIARRVKWFGKQVWAPERGLCRDTLLTISSPVCGIGWNVIQWMFPIFPFFQKISPLFWKSKLLS